jgi:dienelactone hydrolase
MKRSFSPLLLAVTVSFFLQPLAEAQQTPTKRPLRHSDYESWNAIREQHLSPDGKFLAYVVDPEEGDGQLIVRNLSTGVEWRRPHGSRPAPPAPNPAEIGPRQPGAGRQLDGAGGGLAFTADSRTVVYRIYPSKEEMDKARKARRTAEQMPKSALGILDLGTGKVTRIERVRNFQVPEDGNGFIAYLREPAVEERPTGRRPDATSTGAAPARRANRKEYGSTLVLRNLADQTERSFADVLEYTLAKDARLLVYTVSSKQEGHNGIYAVATGATYPPAPLLAGRGKYAKLAWDENQTQLAFLSDRDDVAAAQPRLKLYHWPRRSPNVAGVGLFAVCLMPSGGTTGSCTHLVEWALATLKANESIKADELVSTSTSGFRAGLALTENGAPSFSQDGNSVFFGVAPPAKPEPAATDTAGEDKVVVDLWHWKDDFVQPMQKIRYRMQQNHSFRAVYHLREKKLTQLADETMADVNLSLDGTWGLGSDDRAYRILVGYDDMYSDVYLVNASDGRRKLLLEKHSGLVSWSPRGKYALYFDGKDWHTVGATHGQVTNLTKDLGVSFVQEDHDTPNPAPSHGVAGWTVGDRHVLLYDRYDIWQIAPDGSGAKNLTAGLGRSQKNILRYVRLDPKEKVIDPARPMLLRADNEVTHDTGFYRVPVGGGPPQNLIMSARNFSMPAQAKNADVLLLTASSFAEFPDLMVTDSSFKELKKVSDANPQKAGLNWGNAELVQFKNADGVPLRGIVIKPENFDPNKKYPMLVYIYEKLSQNLHQFVSPAPGTSVNVSFYASNGYLVFMPDIVYTVGYPGQSALKCVLPGIQAIVDRGYVNEGAIGIQGHSWGGYQIAYMITQTHRFKAAAAGAPVANMTSAYGGIRWGSGLPRQFQYERTQSRIGGSLWQYPMRFVENSPLFQADRVQTPLLMLHNDADDAVPWYQGIEYFLALRRLGKEVYLFNYNGELHGLRKRINQKDYTVRLQEFFDHHLKGTPQPAWMAKGAPYQPNEPASARRQTEPAETAEP